MNGPDSQYRRLLVTYLLPHWRLVCLLAALLFATIGLQLLNPQILRTFIDTARSGGSLHSLLTVALLFLGVAVATQVASVAETYVAENVGWLATNSLRGDLALHCLRLDPSFHNAHTPGELIERIDGDVTTLSTFFSRFVVYVLGNALLMVGILVLLWRIDWRVGIALTGFVAGGITVLVRMRQVAVPHFVAARQASAELFGFLEERLAATEDIRSSGATPYAMRRFYERARAFLRKMRRANALGALMLNGTMSLFSAVGMAIALGMGAYLFQSGEITIGTVYLVFSYAQMLSLPIEQITRQLQDLQQAAAGIQRVQRLLETKSTVVDGPGVLYPSGALSVELDGVSFAYGEDEPVLQDVSFRLEEGKVLGVLGRTGGGKTTLSRLIFRLYDPIVGSVCLGGVDLRSARVEEARRAVGMVTQDIQLFHASVRDNLTFFDRSIPDERIAEVLSDLGLEDWLRRLPNGLNTTLTSGSTGLSAGEAQLLAFARVFLKDPGLVVLDEASSRLDPATERRIEHAVDRLLEGRTGVVIAHRLGTVQRADHILILENGRVQEYGPRTALIADPRSHFARMLRTGLGEVLV